MVLVGIGVLSTSKCVFVILALGDNDSVSVDAYDKFAYL